MLCVGALATTSETAGEPYAGKTVRIVVGYPPGGGFDTYARLLARHRPQHIPGKPAVVVENMAGAASLIAANLEVDPVSGEQLEQVIAELFGLNGSVVSKLRELLQ